MMKSIMVLLMASLTGLTNVQAAPPKSPQIFTKPLFDSDPNVLELSVGARGILKVEHHCVYYYDLYGKKRLLPVFPLGSEAKGNTGILFKVKAGKTLYVPIGQPLDFSIPSGRPILTAQERKTYASCLKGTFGVIYLFSGGKITNP